MLCAAGQNRPATSCRYWTPPRSAANPEHGGADSMQSARLSSGNARDPTIRIAPAHLVVPGHLWYHVFLIFGEFCGVYLSDLALIQSSPSSIPAAWPGLTLSEFARACGQSREQAARIYKQLMRSADARSLPVVSRSVESQGTVKFCLPAGEYNGMPLETESVLLPMTNAHGGRWYTLCVSSQIGCRMGCTFCQTGRMGLLANLTAGHIVNQFLTARHLLKQAAEAPNAAREPVAATAGSGVCRAGRLSREDIRNVVFMGMGEPLDNFDAVVQAIRTLCDPAGIALPLSRITVSTVGRIDGLRRLAALNLVGLKLAISISAANDTLRNMIMPVNRAMPLAALKRALLDFPRRPSTRFFIEYVLIADVNDSPAHAEELVRWCEGLPVKVNVIPYNPQQSAIYGVPTPERTIAFLETLRVRGIVAKRRTTIGQDLMGACGQLGNAAQRR